MARASLARVVETLGSEIVEVLTWPADGAVDVFGPCIFDAHDPLGPGDIVLGVNAVSRHDLIDTAAAASAAAVVLKAAPSELAGLAQSAAAAGVALLAASPSVTWDQLYALLRNAVAAVSSDLPPADSPPLGDLFALANAVAAMVGGAVTIEDPRNNVLAYSSLGHPVDEPRRQTILGRRVPEYWTTRLREAGVFRQLQTSAAVVRFVDETGEALPRLVAAIRAGPELLGTIWVAEADQPLGSEAEKALAEAARVAALHVLRHQASDDLDRRERGALLRGLLEGRRSADDVGAALALDITSPCAVAGFQLHLADDVELSVKRARTVDLVTMSCEGFRRRAVCTWINDTVYVLLPMLDQAGAARVMPLIEEITAHAAEALKVTLRAGVGSTVPTVADAPRSRAEADRVLRVLGERAVAHIDDVRVGAILLELADVVRRRDDLRLPALDGLGAHDREQGKAYVQTLRAFLDHFGDVSSAAAAVNLHPNSFRYRLRRLRELTGIDLADPDTRLVIALLLRLAE